MLLPILDYAKELIANVLAEGDVAIDATVGNGYDTLFLAQAVGGTGTVYGFDVQEMALDVTRLRLQQAELLERVSLLHVGHERMGEFVREVGEVKAVMFNLGYLPRSDKTIITSPKTTLPALETAFSLLAPGGLISIVIYSAHEGGEEESDAVLSWAKAIPITEAKVLWYQFLNPRRPPPTLVVIEKR